RRALRPPAALPTPEEGNTVSPHAHSGDTGRTSDTPLLAARNLTKHFPVKGANRRVVHAVDGVDIELHAGEVVALVGESGSGKSTVARLLAKLMPHTSGDVLLEGHPVTARFGRRFRSYCRRVQMILQDPFASL